MKTEINTPTKIEGIGLFVHGEFVGSKRAKDKIDRDTGVATPVFFWGVKIPKSGGFDDEMEYIQVKLTKDQISSGWINRLDEYRGKTLCIPFWLNTFSPKDNQNVYETMFFDEKREIVGYTAVSAVGIGIPNEEGQQVLKGPLAKQA
jgi:hypothetical protein